MYPSQAKGFTLIELMVVIAVVAILAAIALPSFESSMRSNRVATTSNELLASLALARSEAIRSHAGGGLCASASGDACDGGWNDGWIVWTDTVSNNVKDPGETVLRFVQGKRKMVVTGTGTTIVFDPRGRATTGETDIGLKPEADGSDLPTRCISISVTGQTSVKKAACV